MENELNFFLSKVGCNVNETFEYNGEEHTLLSFSIFLDIEFTKQILTMNPDLNKKIGSKEDTIFCICAREGKDDAFNLLAVEAIKQNIDIHLSNNCGSTPLMIASCYGDLDMTKKILEFNPDINVVDEDGCNVIDLIFNDKVNEREELRNLLIDYSVNQNFNKIKSKIKI